ncbi:PREDICTED: PI-PLC X domain-containing protein 3 isoform X2 [Nicrophorus vespilloides]|uniref:PI-PLC X domain-containing protein 3 isoform X2 n=1 Tax=Nicrophorus vespilloides TaxID=110193 RepID=A0ABM1NDS7_NICVS|nr:PREDICTED: PI-PLC X domain-containing protein 3 isoform X2 [Nicrophorus vespilloides]
MADLAEDLANWMGNLPDDLQKVPIIHLAIPGSHDSCTYPITSRSKIAPDAETAILRLRWLGCILKWVMSRWSKTQGFDASGQLQAGIRYFDLRIATKPNDCLHFVHGLYAAPVPIVLHQINDFLNSHSKEVVILDCQHFFEMDIDDHIHFVDMIFDTFGLKVLTCDNYYMKHLSLDYLAEHKFQVIVVYRLKHFKHPFYPAGCYPTPWPNTTSTKELIQILSSDLKRRNNNYGYISQFILTPRKSTVLKYVFGGNLKKFSAEPLYTDKMNWIESQKPGNLSAPVSSVCLAPEY